MAIPSRIPLLLLLAVASAARAAEIPAEVDQFFKKAIEMRETAGVSVAIVKDGKVVFKKGYGFADIQNQVKATPATVYRIGSLTKQFTATIVMQLVNEGKVKLDDPIDGMISDLPKAWAGVTVRQLLNHTGGIPSYTELPKFDDMTMRPVKASAIFAKVADQPLTSLPGTKWKYSNTGYVLLGLIIEKLDGRAYGESLTVRILKPLDMTNTYFTSESAIVPNRAQGYVQVGPVWRNCAYMNMDWPYSAGSIESTVEDLAKWDAALYGDKILPQARLREMWTPAKLTGGGATTYGLGWGITKVNGIEVIGHGGGINGFLTQIDRIPAKGLTIIVLTNSETSDPAAYAKAVAGIMDPTLKPAELKAIADDNPATTKTARTVFESVVKGKLDRSVLTPEFSKELTDDLVTQASRQLSQLGELRAFELIEQAREGEATKRVYRAAFAALTLRITTMTNKQGLIAGMDIAR